MGVVNRTRAGSVISSGMGTQVDAGIAGIGVDSKSMAIVTGRISGSAISGVDVIGAFCAEQPMISQARIRNQSHCTRFISASLPQVGPYYTPRRYL